MGWPWQGLVRQVPAMLAFLPLLSCTPGVTGKVRPAPDVQARPLVNADAERVRVVVMGDQGKGSEVQRQVAQAMRAVCEAQGCDLGVALGDNFYPAGPKTPESPLFKERFADLYGPLGIPFLIIPGNHDESLLVGGDGADARGADAEVAYSAVNPQWVMPARSYRAVTGRVAEFFALDTTPLAPYLPPLRRDEFPGGPWDQAQRAWLDGALARSAAPWKLVMGHYPLFSNGRHGDAGRYDNSPFTYMNGTAVRDLYRLACGKADLILSGHVHALELFAPQAECPRTWQLVSGAAGESGGPQVGKRAAAFGAFGQPGFAWLDITPQVLTVRFYTLSAQQPPQLAFEQQLRK